MNSDRSRMNSNVGDRSFFCVDVVRGDEINIDRLLSRRASWGQLQLRSLDGPRAQNIRPIGVELGIHVALHSSSRALFDQTRGDRVEISNLQSSLERCMCG